MAKYPSCNCSSARSVAFRLVFFLVASWDFLSDEELDPGCYHHSLLNLLIAIILLVLGDLSELRLRFSRPLLFDCAALLCSLHRPRRLSESPFSSSSAWSPSESFLHLGSDHLRLGHGILFAAFVDSSSVPEWSGTLVRPMLHTVPHKAWILS